jgi:hypothetical protein
VRLQRVGSQLTEVQSLVPMISRKLTLVSGKAMHHLQDGSGRRGAQNPFLRSLARFWFVVTEMANFSFDANRWGSKTCAIRIANDSPALAWSALVASHCSEYARQQQISSV